MHRAMATLAGGLLLFGCAAPGPTIQTGPNAVRTPEGLHKVDGVRVGTLYMQPDYAFGSYDAFVLGRTRVSYAQDAAVLDDEEVAQLTSVVENVARRAISGTGRKEVDEAGPCVSKIFLSLVDLDIIAKAGAIGAATLVLEVRDGYTNELLLQYGQRRKLGGIDMRAAFARYAAKFQRDLNSSLPKPDPATTLGCKERAGSDESPE